MYLCQKYQEFKEDVMEKEPVFAPSAGETCRLCKSQVTQSALLPEPGPPMAWRSGSLFLLQRTAIPDK